MMTSAYFYFDQTQLDIADSDKPSGNITAMYDTLSQAVCACGGDPRLTNWLARAGGIHSWQSLYAPCVRGAVYQVVREAEKKMTCRHPALEWR
ncbi:hypothetical protein FUT69_09275 [Xylella taiwanensis]|uniref:RTX toxin Ca2+-binding protein n=2 Tax=Xylella taiwanensis TaxID=1444770 RepID=Z9JN94_9GAMM|nr:hypothetical protein [Xylella taiwanensis]AXI83243.1 hypothetical protein AB672_04480 [Xylella taiwanensis]EWS79222.1 RTX toxin Ca2+-binding protein [Xylella taiwanensis]MCD8456306.1 hypothetical protein [Xylella taiwanensis]MCD8458714.1 hypothetical protein [Xylella taiwanensis]MCD8460849.1 hypothetical protein [Xylella taiwanensis]